MKGQRMTGRSFARLFLRGLSMQAIADLYVMPISEIEQTIRRYWIRREKRRKR